MVNFNEGKSRTVSRNMSVSVIVLGYIILRLACQCAKKEFATFSLETDYAKVQLINQEIHHTDDEELRELFKQGKLVATISFKVIGDTDITIVCVLTPVNKNHKPNLKPIKGICQPTKTCLRKGHLIVIESSVNPGVYEEIIKSIRKNPGLKDRIDFNIAHCLERTNLGYKSKKYALVL